jgi:glucose 1-dehydrogenase
MLPLPKPDVLLLGMLFRWLGSTSAFSHLTVSKSVSRHRPSTTQQVPTFFAMSSRAYDIDQPRSLRGKTALVTGSSGGIGAGIAKVFAQAGADVIVHYNSRRDGAVSTFKEINDRYESAVENKINQNNLPGRCLGIIKADFRDPSAVDEMFRCMLDNSLPNNRLDILVNNAGIVTKLALEDDDDKLTIWHETMAVNLHAPLQLMRLAHRHMKSTTIGARKGGVIINNTSIHGSRSVEFMTAYAASKAALDSLTRGLACEFADDGVRVNAIAPGVVPVERTAEAFADPKVTNMWLPHLPTGKLGTVEVRLFNEKFNYLLTFAECCPCLLFLHVQ